MNLTKEEEWIRRMTENETMPSAWERKIREEEGASPTGLSLHLVAVRRPPSVDDRLEISRHRLRLSLYDAAYKRFVGRSWTSDAARAGGRGVGVDLPVNQTAHVLTDVEGASLVVVIEFLAEVRQNGPRSSNATTIGCGWTMLRPLDSRTLPDYVSRFPAPRTRKPLYYGSPMALQFLEEPLEASPLLKMKENSEVEVACSKFDNLTNFEDTIPLNVFFAENAAFSGLTFVKLSPSSSSPSCRLHRLRSTSVVLSSLNLRLHTPLVEFEAQLKSSVAADRLAADAAALGDAGLKLRVVERRLKVGVHNGIKFIAEPVVVSLRVSNDDDDDKANVTSKSTARRRASQFKSSRRFSTIDVASGGPKRLHVPTSLSVNGLFNDENCGLVFVVEYFLSLPMSAMQSKTKMTASLASSFGGHSVSESITVAAFFAVWLPFVAEITTPFKVKDAARLSLRGGPGRTPDEALLLAPDNDGARRSDETGSEVGTILFDYSFSHDEDRLRLERGSTPSPVKKSPPIKAPTAAEAEALRPISGEGALVETTPSSTPSPLKKMVSITTQTSIDASAPVTAHSAPAEPDSTPPTTSGVSPSLQLREISAGAFSAAPLVSLRPLSISPPVRASRAAHAAVKRLGFPEVVDRHGNPAPPADEEAMAALMQAGSIKSARHAVGANLLGQRLTLQFLALGFSEIRSSTSSSSPRKVFFTFQFFRFSPTKTSTLDLGEIEEDLLSFAPQGSSAQVLRKKSCSSPHQQSSKQQHPAVESRLNSPPGYAESFFVGVSLSSTRDVDDLMEHLSTSRLHVDVWDADSLLPLGAAFVDLRGFLRSSATEASMTLMETEVVAGNDGGAASGADWHPSSEGRLLTDQWRDDGFVSGTMTTSTVLGRLLIRCSNVGFPIDADETWVRRHAATNDGAAVGRLNFLPHGASSSTSEGARRLVKFPRFNLCGESVLDRSTHEQMVIPSLLENFRTCQVRSAFAQSGETGDWAGDEVVRKTVDSARNKRIERLQKIERMTSEARGREEDRRGDPLEPPKSAETRMKHSVETRWKELTSVHYVRNRTKRENILNSLRDSISATLQLRAVVGRTEFFEAQVANPRNRQSCVEIVIDGASEASAYSKNGPEMKLVTSGEDWQRLKTAFGVVTPMEDKMFEIKRDENDSDSQSSARENLGKDRRPSLLYLRPLETVYVPFTFFTLSFSNSGVEDDVKQFVVTFLELPERRPLMVLRVRVALARPVLDRHFRFDHAEQTFVKRVVRVPEAAWRGAEARGGIVGAACSDESVIVEARRVKDDEVGGGGDALVSAPPTAGSVDVFFKAACPPAPRVMSFIIAIYRDSLRIEPLQIWSVSIHCLQRVDLSPPVGQSSVATLTLKNPTGAGKELELYASDPSETATSPPAGEPFLLPAGGLQELAVRLRPLRSGRRVVRVNAVERGSSGVESGDRRLFRAWILRLDVQPPVVSKAFEVRIPVGAADGASETPSAAGLNKCVDFTNPYSAFKTFCFRSDRPDLLWFRRDELRFAPRETQMVGLRFSAAPRKMRAAHLVNIFVNDEKDKNEETFAVRVVYT